MFVFPPLFFILFGTFRGTKYNLPKMYSNISFLWVEEGDDWSNTNHIASNDWLLLWYDPVEESLTIFTRSQLCWCVHSRSSLDNTQMWSLHRCTQHPVINIHAMASCWPADALPVPTGTCTLWHRHYIHLHTADVMQAPWFMYRAQGQRGATVVGAFLLGPLEPCSQLSW